jgi:hypothetical protein
MFWTDLTRLGCAGQFSACFNNVTTAFNRIVSTPYDGNCVGIFSTVNHGYYKTIQCKTKLPMACVGEVNIETLFTNNIGVEVNKKKIIIINMKSTLRRT